MPTKTEQHVAPVDAFAALALHGLAHLPLVGVASLFDPRYVAWSRAHLPEGAREPLASDAAAIAASVDALDAALPLQWLPRLHTTLDAFDRTRHRDLDALRAEEVSDATAHAALRSIPAVEWLRADLLLASETFAPAHDVLALDRACDEIRAALLEAPVALLPRDVRVAWSLGSRGRGFPDVVLVGAPAPWNGLDAATPAVVAMHEHAVLSSRGHHDQREWSALCAVARGMADASPRLRDAHAAWLSSLDLAPTVQCAIREGQIDARTAARIVGDVARRAELLAACS